MRRVILILVPILLTLGVGYWWWSRPDYVVFAQGLRPADAAAVVAELDKRGTPYRLDGGGGTILVPTDRADDTRVALAGSDVAARGLVGFELFNESDMGLTNFAQKINYQRALQGELTRTLLAMDGVENARVHLALPEKSLFRGERAEASAAVAIEMKRGVALDPARVEGIQRLVAAAAIDLPEARVVVLDGAGRQISSNGAVGDNPAPDEREAIRTLFAARADAAIAPVLPGARVTVRIAEDGPVAWDGGERSFPLEVQVVTQQVPGAEEQRRVAAALAIDPAKGDQLRFVTGQAAPVALPAPAFAPAASDPVTDIERVAAPALWPWVVALLALAGVALIAVVRRRRRPTLDDGAQDAFALRLRHAMDGGDPHG
ncbi:flagellar basal-body MS-ring/collar protein FliF [Sphingomonas hankookensis]|uniref:flagellar basal-body MS-ring/collar protein FliF n=1 Tax=Sphingomonas hankookensis TaxID=563996 RepID=UPI001F581EF0|nr:flagellar basal-body MS-ring/collar protein FliF [Sphingomonas hankookensis]